MLEQADLVKKIVAVFEELDIPYMIVGSFVSGVYGEPRFTQDIDVVALPKYGDVQRICAEFPAEDFYVSPEAVARAIQTNTQFNIIHPNSGNKIDVMLPPDSLWGDTQLRRRQRVWLLPDCQGYAARPEDVILSKMIYYREGGSEKHLRDITGILKVSGDEVDRDYLNQWADKLNVSDIWQAILKRLGQDC